MRRIKIALGDLQHQTAGRNSVLMPLGISYIASYALAQLGKDALEFRFYDKPAAILADIHTWQPDVIGLTNYCWNSELSGLVFRKAKKNNPRVITVSGGPEFPLHEPDSRSYLLQKPELDFYVFLEGEASFAELIHSIMDGRELAELKKKPHRGVMSIHPHNKKLICAGPMQRLADLDIIPSPYLSGLMDQWFNGLYAPLIETARGCPFSCGFCYVGSVGSKQLATFSLERIKSELDYIASRMRDYPNVLLTICDSNFGMYERDEKIAEHFKKLHDRYGWPNAFDVSTGKARYDRILRIASLLKNRMWVTCSVQSFNPKTLQVIKRKNLPIDQYRQIQAEIKKRGMLSSAELIMPMPEETKKSFLNGMKMVSDAGVENVVPYTTMLLKGTYLASSECRKTYSMRSKFRILPRQFGEYLGEKCFEIEEGCISTNTMSFDEYLELRGFALVVALFSAKQFNIIHKHLKEFGVSEYDYYYRIWKLIKAGTTELSGIYSRYISESKRELWASREAIYRFFAKKQNYEKLLDGRLGDNLIRKYRTELLLKKCLPAIELAYAPLVQYAQKSGADTVHALSCAKAWMSIMRDFSPVFKTGLYKTMNEIIDFAYDIRGWYNDPVKPLSSFRRPVTYRFFYESEKINRIIRQNKGLWGDNLAYMVGKIFIYWSMEDFWCTCEPVDSVLKAASKRLKKG